MVLFNALANGAPKESSESNSSSGIKEEEMVRESLQDMNYRCEDGCSPVVALKRKHSMRRKSKSRKTKVNQVPLSRPQNVVVLEDLELTTWKSF
ncbi:Ethylene-responsive transcription factor 1B [Populus alba x Populus x berolinensis]|uniref:Ethylene-responsive transcription factor 1B n=1 Tax=Populus alba x Populus x berolinensis TaxID=444605 RepID=A0AAD6QWT2_9ROSI|nr:Ethylene-responsive transcription factor 1B [Populus alba x Populus x berolinensis]